MSDEVKVGIPSSPPVTFDTSETDGGPAFPIPLHQGQAYNATVHKGMSLRDYFAGQALAGVYANKDLLLAVESVGQDHSIATAAKVAYAVADAMLAARDR